MPSGKAGFEKLLDTAISPMLLEPSWVTNLEICDAIRQNDVPVKYALQAIRKRVKDSNPHITKYALVVLETCVKNCGEAFHEEIATHDFMNEMRTLAQTGSAPVKEQVLKMVQAWNHAFRNNSKYQPILATYNIMKMEDCNFPPLNESDAMFDSSTAPSWKDGGVCHLCRVKFGTFTRQHHCRACGEVFCSSCSSKKSIIPKIGMEREVRVCDPCFDDINPNASKPHENSNEDEDVLPAEYLNSNLAKEPQTKPTLDDAEAKAQEEDELQLALALSLSQQEANKNVGKSMGGGVSAAPRPVVVPSAVTTKSYSAPVYDSPYSSAISSLKQAEEPVSELDKYLDRSYWEKKSTERATSVPSAPVVVDQFEEASVSNVNETHPVAEYHNAAYGDEEQVEDTEESFASDAFVNTVEKSIDMFVDHMNKAHMKGKHIAMDTSVQSLFHSLSAMHPQLLQLIEDEEDSKVKYQAMLEKLAIIREARDTLDDMRAQHQEKTRQQELEQEMLRRMQMEQKLELMRQQKQEYLEYQRQLQIQRQMELDNYQKEKMMQKVIPQDGYPGAYPTVNGYPAPIQQSYSLPYANQAGDLSFVSPKQTVPQQTFQQQQQQQQPPQQQYHTNIQQFRLPNGEKASIQDPSQYPPYQQQQQSTQTPPQQPQLQPQKQQISHAFQQQGSSYNPVVSQPPGISDQPSNPRYGKQQQPSQQMYKQGDWQQQQPLSLTNEPSGPQSLPPQNTQQPLEVYGQPPPPEQHPPPQQFYRQDQQHFPPTPQAQPQGAVVPPQQQLPQQTYPPQPQLQQQPLSVQQPQQLQHQPQYTPQQQVAQNSYLQQNQVYISQPNQQQQQGFYAQNQQQGPPNNQQAHYQQQSPFEENPNGNMQDLQLISFD